MLAVVSRAGRGNNSLSRLGERAAASKGRAYRDLSDAGFLLEYGERSP